MRAFTLRTLIVLLGTWGYAQAQPLQAEAAAPEVAPTAARAVVQQRPGRGGRGGGQGDQDEEASDPQSYDEVVTSEAETRTGMFTTHKIGDQLLFEIPPEMLGQDQLLVIEIAETALGIGYGGQAIGNAVYRWEQQGDRVMLREVSYSAIADDGSPEAEAVSNANVAPIVTVWDIEAYGPDGSIVIDVSETFTDPPPELGLRGRVPGDIDSDRTWVDRAVPYPDNVNVYSTLTFSNSAAGRGGRGGAPAPTGRGRGGGNNNASNTVVVSWSFHHLPKVPMKGRLCDDRVGYFSARFTDFTSADQQVKETCYISRYRLEKKNPAQAMSDPVKPIIYYIDPATPAKWIPFFKAGVEQWQEAFEAAGFSNAILAMDPPDDPDWSPEDARYSVIRWLPSTTENASGPHVHDPRSGEILSAHIQFYQNVQRLNLTWYFTQTAAVDPRARIFPFEDDLMGELLQYVVAHEVGHTLGFQHNMKASAMYPADSLRSESFLREWGHTPTLMDYSRYNYLVQPEDNIPVELLIPSIGPYDRWATKWGYAEIPEAATAEDERPILDEWAREQDDSPWLRFTTSDDAGSDPADQTEAVGDSDPVKSTGWGIANLERAMAYLIDATVKPTDGYDDLETLYGRMVGQWRTELSHVARLIGGADTQEKYGSQPGARYSPVSRDRQVEAVAFLNEMAFKTPDFLLVDSIVRRIEPVGSIRRVLAAQTSVLNLTLQNSRLIRMSEYGHSLDDSDAYTILELFGDVRDGVFTELSDASEIDVYRRSLQRRYIETMSTKINPPPADPNAGGGRGGRGGRGRGPQLDAEMSDIHPGVRSHLKELDELIAVVIPRTDGMQKAHLEDLRFRIAEALKGRTVDAGPPIITD